MMGIEFSLGNYEFGGRLMVEFVFNEVRGHLIIVESISFIG